MLPGPGGSSDNRGPKEPCLNPLTSSSSTDVTWKSVQLGQRPRTTMGSEHLHLLLDIFHCQAVSCHIVLPWEFLCQQLASVYV